MISFLILATAFSASAQEYIGVKSSDKGNCRLYRERFVVDSGQFKNDLKKQVSYREKLITAGKQKVSDLALSEVNTTANKKSKISNATIIASQVQDDVSGSDLLWTFEYCVYDKPIPDQSTSPVGTTGLAQKVFGNPDGSYTIEYPRVLHAGRIYYFESVEHYADDNDSSEMSVPRTERAAILRHLCQRFGFKSHISHSDIRVQDNNTVRLNRKAIVISTDNPYSSALIHHLTCK